eukprot:COSAG01_NODE_7786_length_3057_cov_8.888438_1_plen_331_part_10
MLSPQMDRASGRSKGFGFVTFACAEDAQRALTAGGAGAVKIDGRGGAPRPGHQVGRGAAAGGARPPGAARGAPRLGGGPGGPPPPGGPVGGGGVGGARAAQRRLVPLPGRQHLRGRASAGGRGGRGMHAEIGCSPLTKPLSRACMHVAARCSLLAARCRGCAAGGVVRCVPAGRQLPTSRGRFNPERAAALGVPRGKAWGQLANGQAVTTPEGRLVQPAECVGATLQGSCLLVLRCPDAACLEQLQAMPRLRELQQRAAAAAEQGEGGAPLPLVVVHMTAPTLLSESAPYHSWVRSFGAHTRHVLLPCADPPEAAGWAAAAASSGGGTAAA